MKWVLTHSNFTAPQNWQHGNCKPEDIRNPIPFCLLDDDRYVYFTGILEQAEFESADGDTAFEPLDGFGAAYGCTELQYRQAGRWITL